MRLEAGNDDTNDTTNDTTYDATDDDMLHAWVARLDCGHTIGAHSVSAPKLAELEWCWLCEQGKHVVGVVDDRRQVGPDGRR